MGKFEDPTQLSQNVKFKTFDFKTRATEIVVVNEHGVRFVLNSDLKWINEAVHKENVKTAIADQKASRFQRC